MAKITNKYVDEVAFEVGDAQLTEISAIADPVLKSLAFNRLSNLSFLGILSPGYAAYANSPLGGRCNHYSGVCDGTRYDHSLGVASIALAIGKQVGLSEEAKRYAVAWALIHDIATWPLSHTSESAFSSLYGVSARQLRRQMIQGDGSIPAKLRLKVPLLQMGVDPSKLISIFDSEYRDLDIDLARFASLVKTPLSPDSLEGMTRTGAVFGVPIPNPSDIIKGMYSELFGIVIRKQFTSSVFKFWRGKAEIYRKYINKPVVIAWESLWTSSIGRVFDTLSFSESFDLPESVIINRVREKGLLRRLCVERYKHPLDYIVNPPRRRCMSSDILIQQLSNVLSVKEISLEEGVWKSAWRAYGKTSQLKPSKPCVEQERSVGCSQANLSDSLKDS